MMGDMDILTVIYKTLMGAWIVFSATVIAAALCMLVGMCSIKMGIYVVFMAVLFISGATFPIALMYGAIERRRILSRHE